jgi:hypothetical protein
MATQAEITGIKSMAKNMSTKDLKWQIANAKKLRIPADLNNLFKEELDNREQNA